jgi:hypothetical protein
MLLLGVLGRSLSGDELSDETIRTMSAWFARHEVDKQAEGFSPGEEGYPSPGRVAWAAWGGDPGKTWSDALVARMESDREMTPDLTAPQVQLVRGLRGDRGGAWPVWSRCRTAWIALHGRKPVCG